MKDIIGIIFIAVTLLTVLVIATLSILLLLNDIRPEDITLAYHIISTIIIIWVISGLILLSDEYFDSY